MIVPSESHELGASSTRSKSSAERTRPAAWRRSLPWIALALIAFGSILLLLFGLNGLSKSWKTPKIMEIAARDKPLTTPTLRVFALNAAKCWFHEGGLSFASADTVRSNLDSIAAAIEREKPDIVFLSEVVMECGPEPLDQVEYLARRCDFARCVSGENYSFGLPFYRIRSGNAVLTSLPLRAASTVQLGMDRPFWEPTNNRRVLWCEVQVGEKWLLVASIRNDSFDIDNNLLQTGQILDFAADRPALLAGDFNAEPETAPIRLILATGRFSGGSDLRPTFPAQSPTRRIDRIFGPAKWKVVDQSVVDTHMSDHLAVTTTFDVR